MKLKRSVLWSSIILGVVAAFIATAFDPGDSRGSRNTTQTAAKQTAGKLHLPRFRRGINLSNMFGFSVRDPSRPGHYLWPPFQGASVKVSDGEIDRLVALGFDFVRLPVDAGPFLAASAPERRLLLDDLKTAVLRLLDRRLSVLVDMHPANYASAWQPKDILKDPHGPAFQAYQDFLVDVAKRLRDLPPTEVALELMNEPQPACSRDDGEDWTISQKRLYDSLQPIAPDLPIVLSGPCWSSIDGAIRLDPAQFGKNTLIDVHFYGPHSFTHQSIRWASVPLRYIAGLTYPSTEGNVETTERLTKRHLANLAANGTELPDDAFDQARRGIREYYLLKKPDLRYIQDRFDKLSDWADSNQIDPFRIVIGEFSAIRRPDGIPEDGSRLKWLADVRNTAEAHGFGWALWDYREGFGLLTDNNSRAIDHDMVKALGLNTDALSKTGSP